MNLSYREINYQSLDDCSILATWHNNPEIQKFFILGQAKSGGVKIFHPEDIYQEKSQCKNRAGIFQFIMLDNIIVGMFSLLYNPTHKMAEDLIVGWPSILVADLSLRRRGLGLMVGREIQKLSKENGATHIEAGVFEYNTPIIKLLESNGFTFLGRREKCIFYEGQYWDGVHYLKELS